MTFIITLVSRNIDFLFASIISDKVPLFTLKHVGFLIMFVSAYIVQISLRGLDSFPSIMLLEGFSQMWYLNVAVTLLEG